MDLLGVAVNTVSLSLFLQDERLGTLGLPEAQNCTKASGIADVQQRPSGSCQVSFYLLLCLVPAEMGSRCGTEGHTRKAHL